MRITFCVLIGICTAACNAPTPPTASESVNDSSGEPRTSSRRRAVQADDADASQITPKNAVFSPLRESNREPTLKLIELPRIPSVRCVWGATGRDHQGAIYIGVSTEGDDTQSAHLLQFQPETGRVRDLGGVVENLTRLGRRRPNESQAKIHTKIWQASDGYLYFASMDETGENEDGSALPTFGSHIWRAKPGTTEWEHISAVREALIASAIGGKYVYFLGYFGHVLYQVDTETGRVSNKVRVGAAGGHTTRNILADDRGHVFVPRVVAGTNIAELVEFDEVLNQVAVEPLPYYTPDADTRAHGIVGLSALKDGGIVFTTDRGRLYRLTPRSTGTALTDLGWIHPEGEFYSPCVFCIDGESMIYALGHKPTRQTPQYEWVTYQLRTRQSSAQTLAIPLPCEKITSLLIYGSQTRDDHGRFYLGGAYCADGASAYSPCLWQIHP